MHRNTRGKKQYRQSNKKNESEVAIGNPKVSMSTPNVSELKSPIERLKVADGLKKQDLTI